MWHVSAPHRACIGHRTGYSLHENARISGLASADFEGVFAHSYKRWRPRLFLRALRKEPKLIAAGQELQPVRVLLVEVADIAQPQHVVDAVGAYSGFSSDVRSRRCKVLK